MLTLIQSIFEIQIMLQSVSRLTAIVLPNGYYYYYIIAVLKYGQDSLWHILLRESHSLPIILSHHNTRV